MYLLLEDKGGNENNYQHQIEDKNTPISRAAQIFSEKI